MEAKNLNDDEFFSVIKTEADLIDLLLKSSDSFSFLWCKFECDIDLSSIVKANNIPGITLLDDVTCRPRMERDNVMKELSPTFYCSNLVFEKKVNFDYSNFSVYVEFENIIFEKGINITGTNFSKGANFSRVETKLQSILGFISEESILILDSRLLLSENVSSRVQIKEHYRVINTRFNSKIDLRYSEVKGQLVFSDAIFTNDLDLSNSLLGGFILNSSENNQTRTEINKVNISETEFTNQVQFSNINFNEILNSEGATFHDNLVLRNVNFKNKNFFNRTVFHRGIICHNAIIEKHFTFNNATFNGHIDFHRLVFSNAHLSFAGSHINSNFWLGRRLNESPMNYRGNLTFQGAVISSDSIVRLIGINTKEKPEGEVNFANTLIKGLIDLRNVYFERINFDGSIVQGNIQDNNTLNSAIKDRRTARLLKHEAKKINNMISATSYQKIEMDAYSKDLTWSYRNIDEKLIMFLNKLSNNHGTNWLQGIPFTFISGLIFYTAFILSHSDIGWFWEDHWFFLFNDEVFWSGFINFVWLPSGFEKVSNNGIVHGGVSGAFFFILGKIAIAYGIYQTIAAFRKHIK